MNDKCNINFVLPSFTICKSPLHAFGNEDGKGILIKTLNYNILKQIWCLITFIYTVLSFSVDFFET